MTRDIIATKCFLEEAMGAFVFVLEMIGTVAFAASGALLAIRKKMDIFGVSPFSAEIF